MQTHLESSALRHVTEEDRKDKDSQFIEFSEIKQNDSCQTVRIFRHPIRPAVLHSKSVAVLSKSAELDEHEETIPDCDCEVYEDSPSAP